MQLDTSDRESRSDYGYCQQNENWYVANRVQGGERGKEQGYDHTSFSVETGLRPVPAGQSPASTRTRCECNQKQKPDQQEWAIEPFMKIR